MRVAGEIDVASVPQLRRQLGDLIRAGYHRILLDLTAVTFCDSAGLEVIVDARRRILRDVPSGHLRVTCTEPVRRVFEVTGSLSLFGIQSIPDADGQAALSTPPIEVHGDGPDTTKASVGDETSIGTPMLGLISQRYRVGNGRTVVVVRGEVDDATEDQFQWMLSKAFQQNPGQLIVDLSAVTFMDSSGLSVLMVAHQAAVSRGGQLCLVGPSRPLRNLLSLTYLDRILPVHGTLDELSTCSGCRRLAEDGSMESFGR